MRISGKVIETKLKKGVSKAGKEWQSKMFVVSYQDGTYEKTVAFELFGENNIQKYSFKKGQNVVVDFSVESREYNGNWYTSCDAWRVLTGEEAERAVKEQEVNNPPKVDMSAAAMEDTSQLPF
jgi:hypothetical protein